MAPSPDAAPAVQSEQEPASGSETLPAAPAAPTAPAAATAAPSTTPSAPAPLTIVPIVYDLPAQRTAADAIEDSIAARQAAHELRAAKFGVPVQPVRETTVLGARRAAVRPGFATGFDVTSAEEAERRAKRAARFGLPAAAPAAPAAPEAPTEGATVDAPAPVAVEALERRRMAVVGETLRENVLHVFGVDDLSTNEILRHFKEYGPSWVEWLNDSSCNIAFEDAFSVRRVLKFLAAAEPTVAPAGDRMGDDDGDGQSAPVAAEGVQGDEALEWREAVPVQGRNTAFVLWMRMATDADVRPERPNPRSKWSRTVLRDRRNSAPEEEEITGASSRRKRRGRRGGRTRSRNELKGVSGARVKKEKKEKIIDIDMPLSAK